MRVEVNTELLLWACERAGADLEDMGVRFPKFPEWLQGAVRPTLKQLEKFANAVHVPIGYLFLTKPPEEPLPIPDFRTIGNDAIGHPSPDLLDTIYICQQRQDWFREFVRSSGSGVCAFVGSSTLNHPVLEVASQIRRSLAFDVEERHQMSTWNEALRHFIDQADNLGVLVMVNGVVGTNTHRKLDPEEFRGFALADTLAPLVFINGSDTKSAQMFTLAHELAHLWLGESGLSDVESAGAPSNKVESWCNQVAAELLVPLRTLQDVYQADSEVLEEAARLARVFKVSTLVILRRIHDAGYISESELWAAYRAELDRLKSLSRGSGGNFYWTQTARVSRRFATALIGSTLEGQTLHRDAFRLLGFSKFSTFQEFCHRLGIA